MNWQKVAAGAASGLIAALMVDLDAWKRWQKDNAAEPTLDFSFDFGLAAKRWLYGAASGAAAAIGWDIQFGG